MSKQPTGLERVPPELVDINALEAWITQIVVSIVHATIRNELNALVEITHATTAQRAPTHPNSAGPTVKKTWSIPVDLWEEFQKKCSGPASPHLAAAVRLYLKMREE